jgi:hypothetical protein
MQDAKKNWQKKKKTESDSGELRDFWIINKIHVVEKC